MGTNQEKVKIGLGVCRNLSPNPLLQPIRTRLGIKHPRVWGYGFKFAQWKAMLMNCNQLKQKD